MPVLKSLLRSLLVSLGLFFFFSLTTLFLGAFENPLLSVVGFLIMWILIFALMED